MIRPAAAATLDESAIMLREQVQNPGLTPRLRHRLFLPSNLHEQCLGPIPAHPTTFRIHPE